MSRKLVIACFVLLFVFGCAGKQYEPLTEGQFRVQFTTRVRVFNMNLSPYWTGMLIFKGVLPVEPVHVEGYVGEKLRFHWDGYFNAAMSRFTEVKAVITRDDYCWAVGRPKALEDPINQFFNRGGAQTLETNEYEASQNYNDEKITIEYKFFEYEEKPNGQWGPGKILSKAKVEVALQCADCDRFCSR